MNKRAELKTTIQRDRGGSRHLLNYRYKKSKDMCRKYNECKDDEWKML